MRLEDFRFDSQDIMGQQWLPEGGEDQAQGRSDGSVPPVPEAAAAHHSSAALLPGPRGVRGCPLAISCPDKVQLLPDSLIRSLQLADSSS